MTFDWPWMLLTLGAVPLMALEYRRLLRRRAARRSELAGLGLVASSEASTGRRRHVAPVLFICALALLLAALARPEATVAEPRREGTVVLAFDVSSSMGATDLTPSRMEAAKSAARAFVQKQPATIRVAVVAFGESGLITQQPTTDRASVLAAIDRLTPQGGTALGRGIQTSLSAIVGRTVRLEESDGSVEAHGQDLGYHGSAAVILLSDGENTAEPDPLEVARLASAAGVRVYPIGLGSPRGSVLQIDGFQVATALDEPTLRKIASTTDAQYFAAGDEQALARVYDSIDLSWTIEARQMEVTALFAGAAAFVLLIGMGLSFVWFGRVI
jgi:Ca-activated chloride channel family protein